MDNSLQQSFVAENDCRSPTVGDALRSKPLADISCLDVLRWGRDEGELLGRFLNGILIE